jgi:hypothetical protein
LLRASLDPLPNLWSGSDDGHITSKNIEDLWEFIDLASSHNYADRRDVLRRSGLKAFFFDGADCHRSKLQEREWAMAAADPHLPKDRRGTTDHTNCEPCHHYDWKEQYECERRDDQVEEPRHEMLDTIRTGASMWRGSVLFQPTQ